MNRHAMASLAASSLMLAGLVGLSVAPASATPKETGCAGGWQVLSVSGLVAQGYNPALAALDSNQDDTICGKPLADPVQQRRCDEIGGCTVPVIYVFWDNTLTPEH